MADAGAPAEQEMALAGPPAPEQDDWEFPVFVGHRRRLSPDDALFETANEERGELAKQVALSVARDSASHLAKESALGGNRDLALYLSHKFECATCHASLPTAHLLSCHVSEVHDSYFAAQAARRMRVYCCLVEGCGRKFCTVEERKQHLVDHHRFPRNYNFDRLHLRRRKGQIRPLPQYQKGHGRRKMEKEQQQEGEEEEGEWHAQGQGAAGASASGEGGTGASVAEPAGPAAAAAGGGGMNGVDAPAGSGSAQPQPAHEEMVEGLSRLSVAAQDAEVPAAICFGRRSFGRGMPGLGRGRGRGRGRGAAAGEGGGAVAEQEGKGEAGQPESS